jgi:hypothetical protein
MSDTTSPLDSAAPVERSEGRWPISRELRAKAVRVVEEGVDHDDKRIALSAAKLLTDVDALNIRDEIETDKRERLDRGLPTEISDSATLGAAIAGLADQLGGILGNRPDQDQAVVTPAELREGEARRLADRSESGDDEPEAAKGV